MLHMPSYELPLIVDMKGHRSVPASVSFWISRSPVPENPLSRTDKYTHHHLQLQEACCLFGEYSLSVPARKYRLQTVFLFLHYRADAGSGLELRISLDSQIRHVCSGYGTSELVLEGQAPVYAAPSYYSCEQPIVYEEGKGTRFAIGISVQAPKGCIRQKDNTLLFSMRGSPFNQIEQRLMAVA